MCLLRCLCLVPRSFIRRECRMFRYAFRSPEKVALQEIGPRFTLKLRSLKKGLPDVKNLGAPSKPLQFDTGEDEDVTPTDIPERAMAEDERSEPERKKVVPPTEDECIWVWKVGNPYIPRVSYTNVSRSPN